METPPLGGPLRAFRDRYVAGYGGVSYDLAPRALGVHPERLAQVPELEGRTVLVSLGRGGPQPLSRRPAFTVVATSRAMRNAAGIAERGGVVFSCYDLDDPDAARLLADLGVGDPVFLNAALDRLVGEVVRRPGGLSAS